jgi:hypothetical protein
VVGSDDFITTLYTPNITQASLQGHDGVILEFDSGWRGFSTQNGSVLLVEYAEQGGGLVRSDTELQRWESVATSPHFAIRSVRDSEHVRLPLVLRNITVAFAIAFNFHAPFNSFWYDVGSCRLILAARLSCVRTA